LKVKKGIMGKKVKRGLDPGQRKYVMPQYLSGLIFIPAFANYNALSTIAIRACPR